MSTNAIRKAEVTDCRVIAELYRISSDGVFDYIWSQMALPGEDLLDIGEKRYARRGIAFSFENCMVVERQDKIAGMMVSFPMHVDPVQSEESDPVLAPYCLLEEDNSYYICGVALFPEYRNQGVGSELLRWVEKKAMKEGYYKLSLIVFEQNHKAKKLYDKLGYIEVARERVVPHPLIHYTGDALLMVKYLT